MERMKWYVAVNWKCELCSHRSQIGVRLAVREQAAKFSFGSVLQDALAIRRAACAALRRTQWCVSLPEFRLRLTGRKAETVSIQPSHRLRMSPPVSFWRGQ